MISIVICHVSSDLMYLYNIGREWYLISVVMATDYRGCS